MTKITLQDFTTLSNTELSAVQRLNQNNSEIEVRSDSFLSRDGTAPNTMGADLDMNSNRVLNLVEATTDTEPVRRKEFMDALIGDLDITLEDLSIDQEQLIEDVIAAALDDIEAIAEDVIQALELKTILTQDTTFWVRTDGINTGTIGHGLADTSTDAFLTWQFAADHIVDNYDFNGFAVTLRAGGTGSRMWTEAGTVLSVPQWLGGGTFNFLGDTSVKDNVRLHSTGNHTLSVAGNYFGQVNIGGFHLTSVTSPCFSHRGNGRVHFNGYMYFTDSAGPFIQLFNDNSYLALDTGITMEFDGDVSPSVAGAMFIDTGTFHGNGTILVTGTRTFPAFISVNFGGYAYTTTVTGSWTGLDYDILDGGQYRWHHQSKGEAGMGGTLRGRVRGGEFLDGHNQVTRWNPSIPIAYATVTFSGSNPSVVEDEGFTSSVTDEGVGQTRLNLTRAMDSLTPGLIATLTGTLGFIRAEMVNSTQIRVVTQNTSGAAADIGFSIAVFGVPAAVGPA